MFLKFCCKCRSNDTRFFFPKLSGHSNNARNLGEVQLMMECWKAEPLTEIRELVDPLISLEQVSKGESDSDDWANDHRIITDNLNKRCEY
jgi:hypothetical protein